jgi:hypothetical protein
MSGSGQVQDMNNRLKQNRSQRPSKRAKFKGHNLGTSYSSTGHEYKNLKFKTVSKKKLTEIIKRIRERAKKEHQKEGIVLGVLVIIVIITAISLFRWI